MKVAILTGTAGHFCSALNLFEHVHRAPEENFYYSRRWHSVMDKIQFGGLAVVSALSGAVIGGGLDLAAATNVALRNSPPYFNYPKDGAVFLCAVVRPQGLVALSLRIE